MAQGATLMTEYAEEVLTWMHAKERDNLPYNGNSPQLSMRGTLVEFMRVVSEKLRLSVATTHLSVYLLDRFMDAHHISDNQLQLTALTSILVAAKFEEKDMNVPRIPELNVFASSAYSMAIFNSMETFMLAFFNWNVGTVTVAHFAEFYLMEGVTLNDTCRGEAVSVPGLARKILWKATAHFVDFTLLDQAFSQWRSSQIAAACIACGRICCRLVPTWPLQLQATTGYQLQTLSHIMDLLLRFYENESKRSVSATSDSGYSSQCSSTQGSPSSTASQE